MTDDTRDIAIGAAASSKAGHHRLDGINGQIKKLGDSHEALRADFGKSQELIRAGVTFSIDAVREEQTAIRGEFANALYDPEHGLVVKVADLTATVRTALKVAGALCTLVIIIAGGVAAYAIEHHTATPVQAQSSQ